MARFIHPRRKRYPPDEDEALQVEAGYHSCRPFVQLARPERFTFFRILRRALFKGLIGGLLLSPPLIITWFVVSNGEAREILLYVSFCIALAGFLFGVGWEIIDVFGKKRAPPSAEETALHLAAHVGEKLLHPTVGEFLGVAKILIWFLRRDPNRQEPGKRKRSFIGAVVLAIAAVLFFAMVLLFSKAFDGYSAGDSMLVLLGAMIGGATIGGLLGALSDSF